MKKILLITLLILVSYRLFGQVFDFSKGAVPLPVPLRNVNGIVRDSTGQTIIGATITLKSAHDTVRTSTNEGGIFAFKDIKDATFVITVDAMGYERSIGKFHNNDAVTMLTLDPIELKIQSKMLNEVKVNGRPSIIYKQDTVEYMASDYKVRENATLDELLKKAEGFEVGNDGLLTHQGQEINKVKLNGKEYAGGNVAQAIHNLPADIVDKFQVVDDYGDQAARTGIKDGNPQKVLNVTTRADRSIGNTARITAQGGNNGRFNTKLFTQRINANQELSIIGNLSNTVNGIASSAETDNGGPDGTMNATNSGPGTTKSGSPTFSYRDQWGKSIQIVGNYGYNFTNNNAINNSYGQRYTSIGTSNFVDQDTTQRNSKTHNAKFEMDINLDSTNYLQISPTYSYAHTSELSNALTDNINNYATGFEHEVDNGASSNLNTEINYGLTAFYLHVFKKTRRTISAQTSINRLNAQANGGTDKNYRFYADSTQNTLLKDSAVNLLTNQSNKNTVYETTLTYVEPISMISQFEFIGNMRKSDNDSRSVQDTVLANGGLKRLTNLNQIYSYSTIQERLTVNYRYNGSKVNLTLGTTAMPYNLRGVKVDNSTGLKVATSQSNFRIIPAFRFSYTFSQTERFQLTYSGANREPDFQEVQPFTDRSDPRNIIVGNPDLNPEFTNTINAAYNNYMTNERLDLSFNINATSVDNKVTTNTLQIRQPLTVDPIDPAKNTYTNINEIHFINLDGAKALSGRYSISKQLGERKYNLTLNGNINYSYTPAMSNGLLYHNRAWRFDERFGPRINPTDNIEINPFVEYDVNHTFTTALNARPTNLKTTRLAVDGKMYFLGSFQVNYSASKNFVTGISGYNTNPFVLNAGFQKEFLKRHNLALTFDIYDLLHQNNFIQQIVTPQGVVNTLSNTLSRYFLIGLKYNLQKWSGTPTRNGKPMKRRGDGSFIY